MDASQVSRIEQMAIRGSGASIASMPIMWVGGSDILPAWWSYARDKRLRELVIGNDYLGGIMQTAIDKLTSIPLTFKARNPRVSWQVNIAEKFNETIHAVSEDGMGLTECFKVAVQDYLGTDNGMFLELIGDGEPDSVLEGPVLGIRHLDSLCCRRTGDPIYPVTYREGKRSLHRIHFTRIIFASQQPSSDRNMNGVGLCAVSRSVQIAQILYDEMIYKQEKMGSRPTSQLLWSEELSAQEILKAFAISERAADQMGLRRYGRTIAVGQGKIGKIDLGSTDPFDKEQTTKLMYALSFAWGLDIRDVWPVGGSGGDAEIANMKARGKLPSSWTKMMAEQLGRKVCPPFIVPEFDYQDDQEDNQRAVNQDIRARSRSRDAESGIITVEVQRRLALQAGDISRIDFVTMELEDGRLEDGSSVSRLFYDESYMDLLSFDGIDPLLVSQNRLAILNGIERNEALIARAMNSDKERAMTAMAAIKWLKGKIIDKAGQSNDN